MSDEDRMSLKQNRWLKRTRLYYKQTPQGTDNNFSPLNIKRLAIFFVLTPEVKAEEDTHEIP